MFDIVKKIGKGILRVSSEFLKTRAERQVLLSRYHQIALGINKLPFRLKKVFGVILKNFLQYQETGDGTYIRTAIAASRYLLKDPQFSSVGQEGRLFILHGTSQTYIAGFQHYNDPYYLNQGLSLSNQALELAEGYPPIVLVDLFSNIGVGMRFRYTLTGNLDDLQQSIGFHQRARALVNEDDDVLPAILTNLTLALYNRYVHTKAEADVQQAVDFGQQAVDLTPQGSAGLPLYLYNLSGPLRERYLLTGNLGDLEETIKICQKAVRLTPENSLRLFRYLNNLGVALRERYLYSGDLDDLQQAVTICRRSVNLTPQYASELPRHLNNLGLFLWDRYEQVRNRADLDESIALLQRAVEIYPPRSFELPGSLNNLGNSLRHRYAYTDDLADLDAAIKTYRQALKLIPDTSPHLPRCYSNLGNGLSDDYRRTGHIEVLQEATSAYKRAIELTPLGSPEEPARLVNLGNGLQELYKHTQNPQDMQKSQEAFREGCQKGRTIAVANTLTGSRNWGDWAWERKAWPEASEAYNYGLRAMARLFEIQLLRSNKKNWLSHAQNLPPRAAYALAHNDDFQGAVLALEQGRARLFSEALGLQQADLEELEDKQPDLVHRYRELTNRLAKLQGLDLDLASKRYSSYPTNLTNQTREVSQKFDLLIEEIRQVDGYQDFLEPPTFAQIQAAAEHTPLVYLAVTQVGGLAVIIQSDGNITPLWRDHLTEEALQEKVITYRRDYDHRKNNPENWRESIEKMTRWLWDVLMGALVEEIGKLSSQEEINRVVLIPQGLLGLLPLHAAWTEDQNETTGRRYALDTICFSYVPNARALIAARARQDIPLDALFAVDNPDGTLSFSAAEVAAARFYFQKQKTLDQKTATYNAVKRELADYPVLHFSTHGWAGWDNPLSGGLTLANGEQLTLKDILALQLDKARLAILSACETGIPGTELPDEVVGLPTGLVQAGISGVVASLWSVKDASTMILIVRFYDLWRNEGLEPAEALRQAQIWLRDTTNEEKEAYFQEAQSSPDKVRMAAETAKLGSLHFMICEPEEREYEHPFYWAAFSYTGV